MTEEVKNEPDRGSPKTGRRITSRLIYLPILVILGLYFISMTASAPTNLGIQNGRLAKCPASPNCVSTQAEDESKRMPAIAFDGTKADAIAKIKAAIADNFSRAKLVGEDTNYLHYEFTSLIFRFVDDVEFLVDDELGEIHFRSASRVGHSDLGANRKRMQKISDEIDL